MTIRGVILCVIGLSCAGGLAICLTRDRGGPVDKRQLTRGNEVDVVAASRGQAFLSANLPEPTPEFASVYRNTAAAHRVGSERCAECHLQEAAAFAATPHAHSLERVRIDEEPPDAEFVQTATGLVYEVDRESGAMWHRERSLDGGGNQVAVAEHPIAWRIGSGHHSRSYLVDIDGYLFESPITWYASKSEWGMSPGFDIAEHEGFARAASDGCVECHSGRIESVGESTQQLKIVEAAIGCENCHGRGSLHVEERLAGLPVDADFDDTIVNPRKLARELNESICARCHLRGSGWALVRGRDLTDFQPGLPLADYRVDFVSASSSGGMEVVGHFEQMHASRCYTQTDSLTCTSCHNPHESPAPEEQLDYYRNACLKCHGDPASACGVSEEKRRMESPDDDCAGCHMPKSETDIPHFTFTHHRIGINHAKQQESPGEQLVPFGDVSRLSAVDLQRCLGVALARPSSHFGRDRLQRVLGDLKSAYEHGLRDAHVLGSLAYVLWNLHDPACLRFAEQALAEPDCPGETRISSLIVLGDTHLNRGEYVQAEAAFEELTRLRPRYTDWQMLGVCRSLQNESSGAIDAFRKGLDQRPGSADLHWLLAEELTRSGRPEADEHRRRAEQLGRAQGMELRPAGR